MPPKTFNRGHSEALSVYLANEFYFDRLTLNAGIRLEDIDEEVLNRNTGVTTYNDQKKLCSISLLFPLSNKLNLIAGIHQGFSPSARARQVSIRKAVPITNSVADTRTKTRMPSYLGFIATTATYSVDAGSAILVAIQARFSAEERSPLMGWRSWRQAFVSRSTTLRLGLTYTYTKSEFQGTFYLPSLSLVR